MGSCLSSTTAYSSVSSALTATVISVNGASRQYPIPTNVSQVLGLETTTPDSFFLCSSDNLFFDQYIPPLDSKRQLEAGQIYFVLPVNRLKYTLTAREMAAMAVKASVALSEVSSSKNGNKSTKRGGRRPRKRVQISPVLDLGWEEEKDGDQQVALRGEVKFEGEKKKMLRESEVGERMGVGMGGRSKSVKRVGFLRSASRRKGKVVQRPFKLTLTTIHEGFIAE